jgi:hypothetical protein
MAGLMAGDYARLGGLRDLRRIEISMPVWAESTCGDGGGTAGFKEILTRNLCLAYFP